MGDGPKRTCLACNARVEKSVLLRYVWDGEDIVSDPEQKKAGRGAYHCGNEQCEHRFRKNRKRLERSFRLT